MKLFSKRKRVKGWIAHHDLADWWLASFTEFEQKYISDKYQPLGAPRKSLTTGEPSSTQPTSEFLLGLSSWFTESKDRHIIQEIHQKIDEIAGSDPTEGPGYYRGRHFTTYVYDISRLKKAGRQSELEQLLLETVTATEAEDLADRSGVAPWYYEQLAILYRKQQAYGKEVKILERFALRRHAPGKKPRILLDRLDKARKLLEQSTDI